MTKYQQTFQEMLENNTELFSGFKKVHDLYLSDEKKYQKEFNEIGEKILDIIRKYENLLCNTSESGRYSKYSTNLSDKFWGMIRSQFSKIDFIGMK